MSLVSLGLNRCIIPRLLLTSYCYRKKNLASLSKLSYQAVPEERKNGSELVIVMTNE